MKNIDGLVAQIIDTRTLALNVGSDKGVKTGMIFEIYGKDKHVIKDPVSNDILGEIDIPKVQVKVIEVRKSFCIARTFKTTKVNVGGMMDIFSTSRVLSPPKYVDKVETLADEDDIKPLNVEDSKVKIGDRASLFNES